MKNGIGCFGVNPEALCLERKKRIHSSVKRIAWQLTVRFAVDKLEAVKKYHANSVFAGSDWKGTPSWNQYEIEFAEESCEAVYLGRTARISSTVLRDRLNSGERAQ